ncbi:MFS transporter [Streptomyces sp. DSM 42041]|uniref:MFS transporter n=1 Tax=Streptomyces hazeniae TaxID=3075538 RepID=A0ABU2P0G5_9ACTN|nr:MFS transporter [Streptomyces sp. DSM 42041]MDT0381707.1 MFS transporter [Streptomyces sp. DSM 42041]
MATAQDHRTTRSDDPIRTGRVPAPHPGTAPSDAGGTAARPGSSWTLRLVVVGLVLAALNLRPAISGLGPLLEEVRAGLGMSGTFAGLLTSMPSLCFAVFGGLAPRLARRYGPAAVLVAGMIAITTGLALRPFTGSTALFLAGSVLALAGIAVSNVLMPVVVKHWFPGRVGAMTGLYSMALAVGTAGAAAVTVPLTDALGGNWRVGLAAWAVLGALSVVPWAAVLRGVRRRGTAGASSAAGDARARDAAAGLRISRSPTAWALGVFFGLQASAAYITMGWLPQIFRDAGVSASAAGLMLAVTMGMGIPLSFVLPRVAARMSHQGPLAVGLGICGLAGYAGLWFAPAEGAWAWVLLLGVSNCAFPLVLTMIGMRSRTSTGVVKLSAFAQSTGYLLSIPGPLLVGALRQHSGGWHAPLLLMAGLMLAQIAVGTLAGRDRCVEDGR